MPLGQAMPKIRSAIWAADSSFSLARRQPFSRPRGRAWTGHRGGLGARWKAGSGSSPGD